jgi:hypothetical protein
MKVKDTNLVNVNQGDILLFKYRGLIPEGDVLGFFIATLEGGKGQYTHAASVRDIPDPEAEVLEVSPGIFKVTDGTTWKEPYTVETPYDGQTEQKERLRSHMGIKLEATWPKCQEWPIDWENAWMEVWRCRDLMPDNVSDIIKFQEDMIGWEYNLVEFLSFGLLNEAAAKICSQFVAEPIYSSTLLRGTANGNYAIALTPDLAGIKDQEITPNDLYDSEFLYRVHYQGLLGS